MKASNFEDVGQIRSRSGISMKMMMKELALGPVSIEKLCKDWRVLTGIEH